MKTIKITDTKYHMVFNSQARNITTFSAEDIKTLPVGSVQAILEYMPSVDIRTRGADGAQADMNIRGGSFGQTLLLLNGIPVNDPQTGHNNLSLPVAAGNIRRVEVLHGSGARIYGANAMSGAVNIITGPCSNNTLNLSVSGGSYDSYNAMLSTGLCHGPFKSFISMSLAGAGPYIKNTDYKEQKVYLSSSLDMGNIICSAQLGYYDKSFGANSFYSAAYPDQFEQLRGIFASASLHGSGPVNYSMDIYMRHNRDRFELFRNFEGAEDWYNGHNHHETDMYGIKARTYKEWAYGTSDLILSVDADNILSNKLGEALSRPQTIPGESTAKYLYSASRQNFSLALNHEFQWSDFIVNFGALANHNSNIGFNLFPGIDILYRLSNNIELFASANRSLRLPSYTDLYYTNTTHKSSPGLGPENAIGQELGFRYSGSWIRAYVLAFARFGSDMIDWAKYSDTARWQSMNIAEVNSYGLELSAELYPPKLLGRDICLNSVTLAFTTMDQEQRNNNYISKYVFDYLKYKLVTGINISPIDNWNVNIRYSHQRRQGSYIDIASGNKEDYNAFGLLDLRSSYSFRGFVFNFDALNLLDTKYYDYGNVPLPGMWLRAGLSYNWKFS